MSNQKGVVNMDESLYSVTNRERSKPAARPGARSREAVSANPPRASSESEEILVAGLQSGDRDAFDAVFRLYSPKLFKIAYKILGDAADTEEVVQDVFWTMFKKIDTFHGKARLSTWLYRLTVNAALGQLRRRKRNKAVPYEDFLPRFHKDGHHAERPVVDWSADLDERYAKQELRRSLQEALDALRPVDKAVVILSDLEGLSDREIAAALGLSVSAAKTRLHRARLFLRGKLAVHFGHSPA